MRLTGALVALAFALTACGESDSGEQEASPSPIETSTAKSEPEGEAALPKPKKPRPLDGVKRQPVFPDDAGDARAETDVSKYLNTIGGIKRWSLIEIDADAPLLTLTTSNSDSASGLGLCTAGMDTSGEGNPEWERVVVLGGDGNPLALKEPGTEICRTLVG
jgi:hypothetical protein